MNLKTTFFALFALCFSAYGSEPYIAHPPKGWECIADPAQLPKKIREIYVGKTTLEQRFAPSINIACEETTLPVQEYVTLAKSYHEGQGGTRCTLLGKLKTASGPAELMQIDRPSQWGVMRFLQAMIIREGLAYVVTATFLKENSGTLSPQMLKAMQSLTLPAKTESILMQK